METLSELIGELRADGADTNPYVGELIERALALEAIRQMIHTTSQPPAPPVID